MLFTGPALPALLLCLAGSTALRASAQTLSTTLPQVDAQTEAAIYHVAGNSTQVPSNIQITSPQSDTVWYAAGKADLRWTGTTPKQFAFQIINTDPSIRASGISLRASVAVELGTIWSSIGTIEAGNYFVRLYDPTDISRQIAISPTFTVKAKEDNPTRAKSSVPAIMSSEGETMGTNGTMGTSNTDMSPAEMSKMDSVAANAMSAGATNTARSISTSKALAAILCLSSFLVLL